MTGPERRYSDQEVALVLQRTAHLEARGDRADASGRGLTRRELEAIAAEAGFSLEALREALADLDAARPLHPRSALGPPTLARRVRALPGPLPRDTIARIIPDVEAETAATGTVTEALGSVRWTSVGTGRPFSPVTQVSWTPAGAETHVQVTRRFDPKARLLIHLLPTAWAGMIGGAIAAGSSAGPAGGLALLAGSAMVGFGIGGLVWRAVARASQRAVERLSARIADRSSLAPD